MSEKTKWDRFCDAVGRFWNGLCNFCRRVTDRKFMLSVIAVVGALTSGFEPQMAAIISGAVATVFVVLKGIVEIAERWKDVKLAEIKSQNGGLQ